MKQLGPRTDTDRSLDRLRIAVGLIVGLGLTTSAHAQHCPIPHDAQSSLQLHDAEQRIRFIQQTLTDAARQEQRFALGWSLTYAGLSAGSWLILPLSSDPRQIVETAFNSGTSAFAALFSLIGPLGVVRDARALRTLLAARTSADQQCATLAASERLFRHAADSELSARSAFAHASSVAFNVGLGLVLAYALKRPDGAAINTTVGITLGELMIATRPTLAHSHWQRYRTGDLSSKPSTAPLAISVSPWLTQTSYGVSLLGSL
jgi:hypothetical protein